MKKLKIGDIVSSKNKVVDRGIVFNITEHYIWVADQLTGKNYYCLPCNIFKVGKLPFYRYFTIVVFPALFDTIKKFIYNYNPLNFRIVHKDEL